jgi:DNA-binding transcriptional regulator YiaG
MGQTETLSPTASAQCAYDDSMNNPTPSEIIAARTAAGQSTAESSAEVHASVRAWQQWEADKRTMPRAVWELYLLHTGQHPEKKLVKKPPTPLRKRSMSA